MFVTSLELHNFRAFRAMPPTYFDQINVLVGSNNAGKSSIIRALHLLQYGAPLSYQDVRIGEVGAQIVIGLKDVGKRTNWPLVSPNMKNVSAIINLQTTDRISGGIQLTLQGALPNNSPMSLGAIAQLVSKDPNHFIVPFLSKRKTAGFQEGVGSELALAISNDMTNLSARLARLSNPIFPGHDRYQKTCKDILGFVVSSVTSTNGQRPGIYFPDRSPLYIDQLGEGVAHIASLLTDLALSEGKLILIEEPETDLHPSALKALLELIIESSKSNQFVISTHSNIVVRYLGAAEKSKIFNVTTKDDAGELVAEIKEIEPTKEARLKVLIDLGYSISDFELWDGWLILEESSAERIIRDYLIPWFVPKLSRVRTMSVNGIAEVEPTFDDFHRMVRYTHLEEVYRNLAWVRVDAGEESQKIIKRLQQSYPGWKADRFSCYIEKNFEVYYPAHFQTRVVETLAIGDRKNRRKAKLKLLEDVRLWLDENEETSKEALAKSAKEIIADLKKIEKELFFKET